MPAAVPRAARKQRSQDQKARLAAVRRRRQRRRRAGSCGLVSFKPVRFRNLPRIKRPPFLDNIVCTTGQLKL
eukprot:3421522-Prymnesium_polylepis.1